MPGPSSDSQTAQTRGPATVEEQGFGGIAYGQGLSAVNASNQLQDPELRRIAIDRTIAQQTTELQRLRDDVQARQTQMTPQEGGSNLQQQNALQASIAELQQQRAVLPKQQAEYDKQREFNASVQKRLDDFISGRDFGVSPQEQALIRDSMGWMGHSATYTSRDERHSGHD